MVHILDSVIRQFPFWYNVCLKDVFSERMVVLLFLVFVIFQKLLDL